MIFVWFGCVWMWGIPQNNAVDGENDDQPFHFLVRTSLSRPFMDPAENKSRQCLGLWNINILRLLSTVASLEALGSNCMYCLMILMYTWTYKWYKYYTVFLVWRQQWWVPILGNLPGYQVSLQKAICRLPKCCKTKMKHHNTLQKSNIVPYMHETTMYCS